MKWTEDRVRTKFKAKVREELRADGLDPDIRPTHEWLRENGYSGIEGFARRNDMTVKEVLEDICGFEPRQRKPLGVQHAESRRLLEEWLETEHSLFNQWGETRINDARTHIRTLAVVAYEELGSTNLLRLLKADKQEQAQLLIQLFSGLAQRMERQGTQSNYTRTFARWAEYLKLIEEIDDHKVNETRRMMGYTYERGSPEHRLNSKQVRLYWREAGDKLEHQALVIILTASGVRRAEPTNIKIDQLRLDRDDPYIVFDEDRKTGAATVPLMVGVRVIEAWIDELQQKDWWDGEWLFPSKSSEDGSRPAGWVNDVIDELGERAGVTFPDGKTPTPKHFRSFWYEHYMEARQEWLAHVEMLAEDQGVSSEKVIDKHYLTAKPERDFFRRFVESYFAAVFDSDRVHGRNAVMKSREESRDEPVQKAIDDYMDTVRDELSVTSADERDDGQESLAAMDPLSSWVRERLHIEHAAAVASERLSRYPPSPKRATAICLGLVCWAAFIGIVWGVTGQFYIDPVSRDIVTTPETVISLILGLLMVVTDLPTLQEPTGA